MPTTCRSSPTRRPHHGGSEVASRSPHGGLPKKDRVVINYERLLHVVSGLHAAAEQAKETIEQLALAHYSEHGPGSSADIAGAVDWLCCASPAFQRAWHFYYVQLPAWIVPFCQWEDGDSLPVHQHLKTRRRGNRKG